MYPRMQYARPSSFLRGIFIRHSFIKKEHKGKRMAGGLSRTFKLTTKLNCFKVTSSHSAYARMCFGFKEDEFNNLVVIPN